MAACHGFGDEIAAHAAGSDGRDGRAEEEPDMGAIARSRAFHRCWDTAVPAGIDEGRHVIEPRFFVKVSGEKPAGFTL